MKRNDVIKLVITLSIFAIIGFVIFSYHSGKHKQSSVTSVEVIDPIQPDFDQAAITQLTQQTNFQVNILLNNLGNDRPFGPLR